ncbi:DUF6491 family protein [Parahaliea mediterranea]|uniref:Uncharacterized protein n=1 Tax=Parahaliea mediterranea TaxID=651086 RepID=A0A939DG34_9GAMM|nr:DUF6491 family protein [Parahaliea mediterranea]MBN7797409.1 hypothetical protein [Parahaliea mediterranea]
MISNTWLVAAGLVALLSLSGCAATATDGDGSSDDRDAEPDPLEELLGGSRNCVQLNRIARTEVVDERTIVFHMNGGDLYANRLPRRCPGLRRDKTIMYKTSMNQLCNVDLITVLDDMGFGFTRGATCGLGSFVPINAGTVELLRE